MSSSQFSRWLSVLLLVGCNAKLQVDPGASGGSGAASGSGTAGDPGAGRGPIDGSGNAGACICDAIAGNNNGGGDPGGANNGGSAPVGPVPGRHGQPCVPGASSVEADGTPAKTTVTTLDRCDNGLACDSTKHCTSVPACPQDTGPCVVHGVPLEDPGAGGTGGSGGAAAAGGSPAGGAGIVAAEVGVTAMAADATHLYWLEYGTRDGLGNYQHDGALFSYNLVDATLTTLASALPGPNALGITSGHAYVAADGGPLIGSAAHAQLLRLALTGGASELVQDAVMPTSFASVGDQAFWGTNAGLYTVLPTTGGNVSTLDGSTYVVQVAADANNVYYTNFASVLSVPQTGNTPNVLASPAYTFTLSGDSVYGVETQDFAAGMILDVVPKTGGAWTRKRALGAGDGADRLQIIGDRYVFSASPPFPAGASTIGEDLTKEYLETGSISSDESPVRLVEASGIPYDTTRRMLWAATAQTVFWSDRSAIFSRSVTGQ